MTKAVITEHAPGRQARADKMYAAPTSVLQHAGVVHSFRSRSARLAMLFRYFCTLRQQVGPPARRQHSEWMHTLRDRFYRLAHAATLSGPCIQTHRSTMRAYALLALPMANSRPCAACGTTVPANMEYLPYVLVRCHAPVVQWLEYLFSTCDQRYKEEGVGSSILPGCTFGMSVHANQAF